MPSFSQAGRSAGAWAGAGLDALPGVREQLVSSAATAAASKKAGFPDLYLIKGNMLPRSSDVNKKGFVDIDV
jgi:hypothetical protein